jgi:membrane-associated phospholipid phosphatase
VGISRVIDNKHNPSDVVAGAFLGSLLGAVFALRAAAQPHRADPAGGEEAPLLPAEAS